MSEDEVSDYEKRREAKYAERQRKEQRARFALAIYRDLCQADNHHKIMMKIEGPLDFAAMACCAVEAADALLIALGIDPEEKIIPDYEA